MADRGQRTASISGLIAKGLVGASAAISRPRRRTTCGPCAAEGHPGAGGEGVLRPRRAVCADYILRDKADCLRAFIYADDEIPGGPDRLRLPGDVRGTRRRSGCGTRTSAAGAFYSYHTDMTWGDPHNYHICLDSGVLGLERCRDIICSLYEISLSQC